MSEQARPPTWLECGMEGCFALALAGGAWLYGGAWGWGRAWCFAWMGAAWLLLLARQFARPERRDERLVPPSLAEACLASVAILLAALLVLQTWPLPTAWVRWLSPARWHLEQGRAQALGVAAAGWLTLSVDAEVTRRALPGVALACMAFLLGRTMGRAGRLAVLCRWLVALGAVQAGLGLFFLATSNVLSDHGLAFARGSFYNRSHYAALLTCTLPLALAMARRELARHGAMHDGQASTPQPVWPAMKTRGVMGWLLPVVMVVALIQSRSRTAFVLLVLGGLLLVVGLIWRRRLWSPAGAAVALLLLVGLVALGSDGAGVLLRFDGRDGLSLSGLRLRLWRDSLAMWRDFPWWGVGLGNYPTLIKAYASFNTVRFPAQAHNEWLEAGVTLGLPGALLCWGALLVGAGAIVRRLLPPHGRNPLRLAAGWALFTLIAFSCVDFVLHIPLFQMIFFALAGALLAWTQARRHRLG